MFIIVKHIHAGITIDDLEQFVRPVLQGRWWQKPAELKAIRIIGLVDKSGMLVEQHGLMRITPYTEKHRLIKALYNREIALHTFPVAEYMLRHWSNDKQNAAGRRGADERRRLHLKMHTLYEKLDF
ncbi:MAG: hypothetical protein CTY19_11850 [Methylomonas sp.]|nr:MAG: hypothetical protein CTY19_11850 [Methylomonas sp.]